MTYRYFDAHTHAHFPAYDKDRDAMLARALESGVGMITVGTTKESSAEAVMLAQSREGIYATIGIHPSHAAKAFLDVQELGGSSDAKRIASEGESFDYDAFRALVMNPKVVAIGECGFDFYRLDGDEAVVKAKQQDLLLTQVKFAAEYGKPLMIHCREAIAELVALLEGHKGFLNPENAGVMHFFTGTVEQARTLLDLGFSFTFGGVLTFARDYDEVVRLLPIDRILTETDAPYVAPEPYRGKRNEPAYVIEVTKKLAELKGVTEEAMAAQAIANVNRVFGIPLN